MLFATSSTSTTSSSKSVSTTKRTSPASETSSGTTHSITFVTSTSHAATVLRFTRLPDESSSAIRSSQFVATPATPMFATTYSTVTVSPGMNEVGSAVTPTTAISGSGHSATVTIGPLPVLLPVYSRTEGSTAVSTSTIHAPSMPFGGKATSALRSTVPSRAIVPSNGSVATTMTLLGFSASMNRTYSVILPANGGLPALPTVQETESVSPAVAATVAEDGDPPVSPFGRAAVTSRRTDTSSTCRSAYALLYFADAVTLSAMFVNVPVHPSNTQPV